MDRFQYSSIVIHSTLVDRVGSYTLYGSVASFLLSELLCFPQRRMAYFVISIAFLFFGKNNRLINVIENPWRAILILRFWTICWLIVPVLRVQDGRVVVSSHVLIFYSTKSEYLVVWICWPLTDGEKAFVVGTTRVLISMFINGINSEPWSIYIKKILQCPVFTSACPHYSILFPKDIPSSSCDYW